MDEDLRAIPSGIKLQVLVHFGLKRREATDEEPSLKYLAQGTGPGTDRKRVIVGKELVWVVEEINLHRAIQVCASWTTNANLKAQQLLLSQPH